MVPPQPPRQCVPVTEGGGFIQHLPDAPSGYCHSVTRTVHSFPFVQGRNSDSKVRKDRPDLTLSGRLSRYAYNTKLVRRQSAAVARWRLSEAVRTARAPGGSTSQHQTRAQHQPAPSQVDTSPRPGEPRREQGPSRGSQGSHFKRRANFIARPLTGIIVPHGTAPCSAGGAAVPAGRGAGPCSCAVQPWLALLSGQRCAAGQG
jgi:hypothetical protein